MARHEAQPLNDGYDQPMEVSDTQMTFPATLGELLPKWNDIPKRFQGNNDMYCQFADAWFFGGWPGKKFLVYPKGDVDPQKAIRHLYTLLRSYEPKQEHKIAAVGWLASRWLDIKKNSETP